MHLMLWSSLKGLSLAFYSLNLKAACCIMAEDFKMESIPIRGITTSLEGNLDTAYAVPSKLTCHRASRIVWKFEARWLLLSTPRRELIQQEKWTVCSQQPRCLVQKLRQLYYRQIARVVLQGLVLCSSLHSSRFSQLSVPSKLQQYAPLHAHFQK